MTLLLLLVLAAGQATDAWIGFRGVPESDLRLLQEVSPHTGLARTWILYRSAGSNVIAGRPDAVYRTTLALGSARQEQLMGAEVRRFGRLLLAYRQDGGNKPAAPTWVGYDAAGPNAGVLDRFYAAVEKSDLVGARAAATMFLANDLEVATRLAALEQKSGNSSEAAKIVGSVKNTAVLPQGLNDVLQKHLKEDTDFTAANAINLIAAHRRLLGTLVK